jgi:polyhydroxyalkanoate synthesis regulator phasin
LTFNASSGSSGSGNIYCDQTISSIGGVTFTAAGSVPSFTFTSNSNSVTFNGNSITGTLATASQPNITSVGTLTNLSVSGRLSTSSTSASSTAWGTTGIQFNTGASTYTSTTAPSTTTVFNSFARPILAASSAATVTNASTLYIDNAPLAGTSITITNAYALHVAAGASLLGGVVSITDSSPSTSSTTGALRVTGGIYIGGPSICAGTMNITGAFTIGGAVTMSNNVTLSGPSNILSLSGSSAYISITNNTASTSSTTGALRVAGGAYFGSGCLFNSGLSTGNSASINLGNNFTTNSIGKYSDSNLIWQPTQSGTFGGLKFNVAGSGNATLQTFVGLGDCGIGSTTNHPFGIFTNNSYQIYVNGSGNTAIGLGATSASYKLEVGTNNQTITGIFGYINTITSGFVTNGNTSSVSFSAKFNGRINVHGEVDVTSDRRIKENIREIDEDECNKFINVIKPVHFKYKNQDKEAYGYIAQDIMKAGFSDLIQIHKDDNVEEEIDEDGFVNPKGHIFTVAYDEISAILHKYILKQDMYIKEQNKEIENLKQQIADIQKTLELLLQKN